jgi:hypothetical protein
MTATTARERLTRLFGRRSSRRVLRVGVDLDGVNYDFGASLRRYLLSVGYPEHLMTAPQRWEFYLDWGLTDAQFIDACHKGVDAGIIFRSGGTLPGASAALHRIADAGHEIHIVTDRSFGTDDASQRMTREWAAEHDLPYTSLSFSRDKTVVPTDVFVEDKLENYDALTAAGRVVYLIDRPWNQVPGGDDRRRVGSISDFADAVVSGEAEALVDALTRTPVAA